ncbi:hypothetical protein BDN72DRAFT_912125 [Pluteus cervinus]|uniref:Uncharacterized protein n=1 Tax=Pluteus cervinus TaxID=181527 RepID=A0ACD2ZZL8_9AGAR|nr:hypothetical protein BDN72DRAFT_912125 [Pluteus cervinus]
MAAFRDYSFSNLDIDPEPSLEPLQIHASTSTHISTPTQKRRLDPASDASLVTPSKRMRFLGTGLANTSASFLVTTVKVTHLQMKQFIQPAVVETVPNELEVPDWVLLNDDTLTSQSSPEELHAQTVALKKSLSDAQNRLLAQEAIMEGQTAQMIVQNMGMEKMNQALFEKEKRKKSDRTVMFPGGRGRHLTAPEVIKQKRELEEARKVEEAEKEARKVAKKAKKSRKEQVDKLWQEILQDHRAAILAWEDQCRVLRAAGSRVKDLPKKPKRQLKPKLTSENDDEMASDLDDDEEVDEDTEGEADD